MVVSNSNTSYGYLIFVFIWWQNHSTRILDYFSQLEFWITVKLFILSLLTLLLLFFNYFNCMAHICQNYWTTCSAARIILFRCGTVSMVAWNFHSWCYTYNNTLSFAPKLVERVFFGDSIRLHSNYYHPLYLVYDTRGRVD